MPYVPPSTTKDIDKKQRVSLTHLLHEKAILGYAFSYEKLRQELWVKLLKRHDMEEDEFVVILQNCVAAFNDEAERKYKDEINDGISAIFSENGIKTLRDSDPFGREKDFIYFESTSSHFSRDKAVEIAVAKYRISAEKMTSILEEATTKRPFVTIQARDVKEKKEENGK